MVWHESVTFSGNVRQISLCAFISLSQRKICRARKWPSHVSIRYNVHTISIYSGHWQARYLDYDEYGVWPHLADELSSRLPLRNLHWNSSVQRPLRSIQSLDVDLKRFTFDNAPQPLLSVQTPYLNLYFVACDVSGTFLTLCIGMRQRIWLDTYSPDL